jgi:hypothetical protein
MQLITTSVIATALVLIFSVVLHHIYYRWETVILLERTVVGRNIAQAALEYAIAYYVYELSSRNIKQYNVIKELPTIFALSEKWQSASMSFTRDNNICVVEIALVKSDLSLKKSARITICEAPDNKNMSVLVTSLD